MADCIYHVTRAGDDMGQAERLADNKDSGDHSSGGSGSECDGIILFGTITKLCVSTGLKGNQFHRFGGSHVPPVLAPVDTAA